MRSFLWPLLLVACAPLPEPVRSLAPSEQSALLEPLGRPLLDTAGQPVRLEGVRGPAGTVVVLTASFCDSSELGSLLAQAGALRAQGVEIVVVSLDHDPRALDGMVRPPEVAILNAEADARGALRAQTVLPTTLLLDGRGQQLRRYDGEVPLGSLARDLERVPEYVARAGTGRHLVAALLGEATR